MKIRAIVVVATCCLLFNLNNLMANIVFQKALSDAGEIRIERVEPPASQSGVVNEVGFARFKLLVGSTDGKDKQIWEKPVPNIQIEPPVNLKVFDLVQDEKWISILYSLGGVLYVTTFSTAAPDEGPIDVKLEFIPTSASDVVVKFDKNGDATQIVYDRTIDARTGKYSNLWRLVVRDGKPSWEIVKS